LVVKTSRTCPKCQNQEILFFPQLADRDDDDNVRPLVFHVVHYDWRDDVEVGKIQAYVCRACGYTELYAFDANKIEVDKIPGAKILTPKK
jgi:predicted nucleic-acid-binding Zn-ribbon protein